MFNFNCIAGLVNVHWQLPVDALSDFEPPNSGSLTFEPGQTTNNFTLTAVLDTVLEGQERFVLSLTAADNNADLSVTNRNAEIIIQPNEGSSGHIEIAEGYRTLIVAEPDSGYDGKRVSSQLSASLFSDCTL